MVALKDVLEPLKRLLVDHVRVQLHAIKLNVQEPRAMQVGRAFPHPCKVCMVIRHLCIATLMHDRMAKRANASETSKLRKEQLGWHMATVREMPEACAPTKAIFAIFTKWQMLR